jgi:hypothetical protein
MQAIQPKPVQPCKAANKLLKVKTSLRAGGETPKVIRITPSFTGGNAQPGDG